MFEKESVFRVEILPQLAYLTLPPPAHWIRWLLQGLRSWRESYMTQYCPRPLFTREIIGYAEGSNIILENVNTFVCRINQTWFLNNGSFTVKEQRLWREQQSTSYILRIPLNMLSISFVSIEVNNFVLNLNLIFLST